jgi:tricorn protease
VIREVVALGPAAIEGTIKPGETLLAVDGEAVGAGVNLDRLLTDRIGKRVVLRIASAAGASRDAVVRPVSAQTAAGLLYRQWVEERRAYVEKISGGKLGYVHIADMSDQSLAQLYLDLDAQNQAKQGVVIDLRNNNGGYINGYALDVFTRRNYLTMTARDRFAVPSRQALGQRVLGAPSVLVINESSLSDAEDFTEGYRALGVGKIVGVPTAGWIIYTSNVPLIDGSTVRTPFIRIQTTSGEDMEGHPRPVDVEVERPLGETLTGHDAQLEAAVKVLLSGGA